MGKSGSFTRALVKSLLLVGLVGPSVHAAIELRDEGTVQDYVWNLDCVGSAIECTGSSSNGTLTITSSGAPTTADYLVGTANGSLSAEQSLGALSTALLLNTVSGSTGTVSAYAGTSCTNQFPRSLNASGAATCAEVALTTDTSGNYVGTVADGTGIDGTASAEGATYTPTLDLTEITCGAGIACASATSIAFDATEISSLTWGTGAFTTMTFDAGATDPVITAGNGVLTIAPGGSDLTISDDAVLSDASPNLELRDTSDNVAYMWHVDTAASYPFEIFRGTDSGSGFSQTVRLAMFDTNNNLLIPQKVAVGGVAPVVGGRLTVNGSVGTDEIQLLVTGANPQTSNLITAENIAGTDQFTVSNTGNGTLNGTLTVGGTGQSTITEGLVVNNGSGTDEDDDFTMNVSGGAYEIDAGAGTFTSTANDVGATVVDQTDNQACTTGCTSACFVGQDLAGANKPLVSCSDTTADICVCLGPS